MTVAEERFGFRKLALAWDFFLGAGGILVSALIIHVTGKATWSLVVFGTMIVLFIWFLFRTWEKQVGEVILAEPGVIQRGVGERRVAWSELENLKLRFYGSRREVRRRSGGVLQLTLKDSRGVKITVDSSLENFDRFVARCAEVAIRHGLQFDGITLNCLMDLGVDPYLGGAASREAR